MTTSVPQPATDEPTRLCEQARALIDARRFQDAQALLLRARELAPGSALVHYCLGILWSDMRRPQDALAALDAATAIDGSDARAHNNRGSALHVLGRLAEAEAAYRRAVALRPDLAQPYMNLGKVLEDQGRGADAVSVYDLALTRGLDPGVFAQYRASVVGQSTERSPDSWVKATFDNFAPTFDDHLRSLHYDVPQVIADLLQAHAAPSLDVLDLGCGTGQVALAMHGRAHRVVGVDLSPRMLELARARNVYAALHEADVIAFLDHAVAGSFGAVCAADVFIYIGDLNAVFANVARVLRPGGWFCFSIEECTGPDYMLLPTGRYAQSDAYIRRLASSSLAVVEARALRVRLERNVPIDGRVYVLRKG